MAQEVATETVEAVRFGFMTDEEVMKLSFRKITNPNLLDPLGNPEPGGLYDPALGPMDETQPCKSCGQRAFYCPGHCGHIDLVHVVYHPLLFNMLYNLLQRTCFFCFRFRAPREEVKLCLAKLNFIMKGDIVGARSLESDVGLHEMAGFNECTKRVDEREWTSLQLTEANSVLHSFFRIKRRKCKNERCGAKNPDISKPTFGWIHMNGMTAEEIKVNIINGHKLDGPLTNEDDKWASDVENPYDEENDTSAVSQTGKISNEQRKKKFDLHTEFLKQNKSRPLLPSEVKEILKLLWRRETDICSFICDIHQHLPYASLKNAGYLMFFVKTLLVPPTKFRPPSKGGASVMEHPQTVLLGKVLASNITLGNAFEQKAEHTKIIHSWMNLQQSINVLFDSKSATGQREMASGICQLLEKKEGMFRQKMMGKRVNFACRSVISPDPYLAVNEIGIPPVFALKLTYPERVTPWNVTSLRDAIINGPDIHPGATHYVDNLSTIKLSSTRKLRISASRKLPSSRGVATQPGKSLNYEYEGKVVMRHLRNGDIVLVNRQPTLHKPSIIALKVRVLPGERTIRFHYANCDSFNADFDGDEINVHFPQDDISRAEAYNIVNADNQYIVPTRGDPKRALIQDHIVSAVLLTKRDTFLTWEQFNELLYASGVCSYGASSLSAKAGKKISLVDSEDVVLSHPPAIIRPQRLWTGKQVITAILNHITRGSIPFTVKKRAKIAREYFGTDESKMKNVEHSKNEVSEKTMKGNRVSKNNIDVDLARETAKDSKEKPKMYRQGTMKRVSTPSMDEDVVFIYKNELVQGVVDKEQFGKYGLVHTVQEMYGSNTAGNLLSVLSRVLTSFLQMHGFTCGVDDLLLVQSYDNRRKQLLDVCLNSGEEVHKHFIGHDKEHSESAELEVKIEKAIRRNGESAIALLDGMMRSKLNSLTSAVTKLFPEGLKKPFRKDCLSLMTLSGAKGGTFNFQQISLLLGQQELEGKRVPRMVSGKTLPCFPPWDSSARAGGFISDRYLTGLRPQEFYFHCMAGREGLVDTAVKTSRSGYLQRCLIKNLECLKVHYDYTVRDADGSIIQFRYGEDGVDVHQKNYLQEFEALAMNQKLIISKNPLSQLDDACLSKYIEVDNELPNDYAKRAEDFLSNDATVRNCGLRHRKDRSNFVKLVKNKYFTSLAQPGEPVGVIAGQSIGEPSTQMTLNTFHHAGRGEMNVTLGIPRLQEILMTASVAIKTPTMTCPLLKSKSKDDAERLSAKLNRVTVADLIQKMEVSVVPFNVTENEICSVYKLRIKLYEPELYPPHTDITLEDCHEIMEDCFLRELEDAIQNHLVLLSKISGIASVTESNASDETIEDGSRKKSKNDDDDDDDDDDENGGNEGAEDLGSDAQKSKQVSDERDYEENPEAEEEEEEEAERHVDELEGEGYVDEDEDEDRKENVEEEMASTPPRKSKSTDKKRKPEGKPKKGSSKKQRAFYVASEGSYFEVHFNLQNEPHILLAQIVEKVAKKVYVKSAGAIEQCKVVEVHLSDSSTGGIPMLRKGKDTRSALQTAGVDFTAFWDMKDELDVRYISSNDIYAMLVTYGVEAARATIITEIFTVFNHYGVSVDMRHLTLIADYMTHTGSYRPMSRIGGIAESISPLGKMSFETASKFLIEAASRMEVDNLETPSSRICLGLPAKVGTGCFDLLHSIDI